MSKPREHKQLEIILREFQQNMDVRKSVLMHKIGVWDDEDGDKVFSALMRKAKDKGIEIGLRITPVIERVGWWTAYPTDEVMLMAEMMANKRHTTEWERLAKVANGLKTSSALAISTRNQMLATAQTIKDLLPSPERSDECLRRIDAKIAAA